MPLSEHGSITESLLYIDDLIHLRVILRDNTTKKVSNPLSNDTFTRRIIQIRRPERLNLPKHLCTKQNNLEARFLEHHHTLSASFERHLFHDMPQH